MTLSCLVVGGILAPAGLPGFLGFVFLFVVPQGHLWGEYVAAFGTPGRLKYTSPLAHADLWVLGLLSVLVRFKGLSAVEGT